MDNFVFTAPVTITVLEEGQEHLDPGFSKYQHGEIVYLNGNDHDWLCDIYADGANLTEEERQAAEWTCTQTLGEAVATASFEAMDWDSNGRHMEYYLKGALGHAQWLITYSAADGLYQGTIYVNLKVEEALTGLPSGITYDGDTAFEVAPGGEVALDLDKLDFTEGWTPPEGATVWKEIWNNDGDWDGVEENWNEEGTVRTNVFPNEGRYLIDLAMGVGNYTYTLPVTVAVLSDENTPLDPDLQVKIRPRCSTTAGRRTPIWATRTSTPRG